MSEKKEEKNFLDSFKDKGQEAYISKNRIKEINENKKKATKIRSKYGGKIPESIIKATFKKLQTDKFMKDQSRSKEISPPAVCKSLGPSASWGAQRLKDDQSKTRKAFKGGLSPRKKQKFTISRYPYNVGEILIKVFSEEGEILFDPFAGHNSRMEIVYNLNRHYVGVDICHEYMEYNKQIKKLLLSQQSLSGKQPKILLIEGDSREIETNMRFDFSFTSPPYWDLELYGPEKEQLTNFKTYKEFIQELQKVINVSYKLLKSGKYCAWHCNDFRRKGKFYLFHIDIIKCFEMAGFEIHDILIVDLGTSIRAAYPQQFEDIKKFPKRHEYIIIGKKV